MGDRKCIVRYRGKKGDMGGIQGCMGNTVGKYRELHTGMHWGIGGASGLSAQNCQCDSPCGYLAH